MSDVFLGVNYNNLRKSLYYIFFGSKQGNADDFENNEKYKYIIPMRGNFENPMENVDFAKDTYCMYWIARDETKTSGRLSERYFVEDGTEKDNEFHHITPCIAHIVLRFIGKDAESWSRVFRHSYQRKDIMRIFAGVCNAQEMEWISDITMQKVNYSGKNDEIAFDISLRLMYNEELEVNYDILEGIDFIVKGNIKQEEI